MIRPRWVLLAAATAVVLVAGCTSGTVNSAAPSTPAPVSTSAPSISAAPTVSAAPVSVLPSSPSRPASSPPRSSVSPTPSSHAPTIPAPPTSSTPTTPPAPQSTCTSLMIRVLQGSGGPGYELDALDFVNTGTTACVLIGVPTVTLFKNGKQVGSPSEAASAAAATSRYRLAPGAVGESKLKDFSTCQAPLSDVIKAVAPASTISTTRPGELRACTLRAYPLTAPE